MLDQVLHQCFKRINWEGKKEQGGVEGKSEASDDGDSEPRGDTETDVEPEVVKKFQELDVRDLEDCVPAVLVTTFEEARAFFLFSQPTFMCDGTNVDCTKSHTVH